MKLERKKNNTKRLWQMTAMYTKNKEQTII